MERGTERGPRFGLSVIIAGALHVAAFGGLWLTRPSALLVAPSAGAEIEIDIVSDPAPSALPRSSAPPVKVEPSGGSRSAPRLAAALRVSPPLGAPSVIPSVEPASSAAEPSGAGTAGAPASSTSAAVAGAGVAGAGSAGPAAPVAPDALPPPLLPLAIHAPDAVLNAPLAQRAATVGVGAGAQVLAVANVFADAKSPASGRATISVEADSSGLVVSVRTSNSKWEGFARELASRLSGKRLRVPSGARGVLVSLLADASTTNVPPLITGEAKATPCTPEQFKRDQAGSLDWNLNPGCNNWKSFTPMTRHRVSVTIAGEKTL